MHYIKHFL